MFLTIAETVGCCLISTFPLLEHSTLFHSGGNVLPAVTDLK